MAVCTQWRKAQIKAGPEQHRNCIRATKGRMQSATNSGAGDEEIKRRSQSVIKARMLRGALHSATPSFSRRLALILRSSFAPFPTSSSWRTTNFDEDHFIKPRCKTPSPSSAVVTSYNDVARCFALVNRHETSCGFQFVIRENVLANNTVIFENTKQYSLHWLYL